MSSTFNIPAGFVLVPREPTFEMNKAAQEAVWDFHPEDTIEGNEETARAAYWAMIAAAPTPTQVAEAPKAVPQVVVGEASKLDPLATAPIDSRWYIGPKSSLVEAVTKAIVFEDCGNTEDWRDNVNLGEAAIRVCDARNPPRCSYCHASTSVPVHTLSDERISEIAAEIEALPNRGGRTHQFARAILVAALTPSPAPSAAPHQGADALREALAELVACKDLKDSIKDSSDFRQAHSRNEEYRRRQPSAWAIARAALAQHQPQQGEQQ